MSNEKFLKLMQDEEFVKRIVKMQTPEEVQNEFRKEGVELSVEEVETLGSIINKSIEKDGQPLTEQELLEIAGGINTKRFSETFVDRLIYPAKQFCIGVKESNSMYRTDGLAGLAGQGVIAGLGAGLGAGLVGVAWAIKDRQKIENFFKRKFKR